jgi:hypothetical protein
MDKRLLLAGLTALPFFATVTNAANLNGRNTATWKVPPGVTKIRVRSWTPDGRKDMDRTLNVEPGELFRLDAIED